MPDWNPDTYLRFASERTQPAADLLSRIPLSEPERVLDLGCGPGNSTRLLRERWPGAEVTGLDASPAMIARAREEFPEGKWLVGDGADAASLGLFDLIFSNAALQWMPDHDGLLPRLHAALRPGGILAVQVPNNGDSAAHAAVRATAGERPWAGWFSRGKAMAEPSYLSPESAYRRLASLPGEFSLWETIYYHRVTSHAEIVAWLRGTFLRRYLDRLPAGEHAAFEARVGEKIRAAYMAGPDGRIPYPFRRLFFLVDKARECREGK